MGKDRVWKHKPQYACKKKLTTIIKFKERFIVALKVNIYSILTMTSPFFFCKIFYFWRNSFHLLCIPDICFKKCITTLSYPFVQPEFWNIFINLYSILLSHFDFSLVEFICLNLLDPLIDFDKA
jgi:hypothetical protein